MTISYHENLVLYEVQPGFSGDVVVEVTAHRIIYHGLHDGPVITLGDDIVVQCPGVKSTLNGFSHVTDGFDRLRHRSSLEKTAIQLKPESAVCGATPRWSYTHTRAVRYIPWVMAAKATDARTVNYVVGDSIPFYIR